MRLVTVILAAVLRAFGQSRDAASNQLADHQFDEVVFRYDPVSATQAGLHQFDSLLSARSRPEIEFAIADWKNLESCLKTLIHAGFRPGSRQTASWRWRRSAQTPDSRHHPAVGEQSGRLLLKRDERHFRVDEPELRAAGRSAKIDPLPK